jgi:RNA polymerase-associated protein LEO1
VAAGKGSDSEGEIGGGAKRRHSSGGSSSGSDIERARKKYGNQTKEKSAEKEVDQADVFGDDLSISSEDDDDKVAKKKVINDDDDNVARYDDEAPRDDSDEDARDPDEPRKQKITATMPEEENEDEVMPETRIDVEVPKITTNIGKEMHFVKLPNFLSIESRPFDPETYEDELDDESLIQQDEEGRNRTKLRVENTIRWRTTGEVDEDNKPVRQSNARMIKWSDGSMSLHLGSEVFDVHKQPLQSDYNHLFIRQGTGLQGQAVFKTKLTFRPHSTESQTHKKMIMSMVDKSTKQSGIKIISTVGNDPETGRWDRMKQEESRLREAMRRVSKVNRTKEKGASKGLSENYLEDGDDSDDDASVSIAKIKNKYKPGGANQQKKDKKHKKDKKDKH